MNLDIHLNAIIARDSHAFGQWMALGAEATIRESLRSFARVVDVEAVLQEALLRVWQVAPRFTPDGRENGLLRLGITIARNLAISETRKQKKTRTLATPEDEIERALAAQTTATQGNDVTSVETPDPFLRRVLAKCFELLPEQPRRVITTRLSSGGGQEDMILATSLNMRLNTFLQNFGRARKLLGDCLRKNGVAADEGLVSP